MARRPGQEPRPAADSGDQPKLTQFGAQLQDVLKQRWLAEFREHIAPNFDNWPSILAETELQGLSSLSIVSSEPDAAGNRNLHVIPYWEKDGQMMNCTFSMTKEGGWIPDKKEAKKWEDTGIDTERLKDEVLRIATDIKPNVWHQVEDRLDFIKYGQPEGQPAPEARKAPEGNKGAVHTERIRQSIELPGFLFGCINREGGFKNYQALIFPGGVLLEHEEVGNAAYIVPINLDLPPIDLGLPADKRLPSEEKRDEIWKLQVLPAISEAKKRNARELGWIQVKHPKMGDPEWARKFRAKLEPHLAMLMRER